MSSIVRLGLLLGLCGGVVKEAMGVEEELQAVIENQNQYIREMRETLEQKDRIVGELYEQNRNQAQLIEFLECKLDKYDPPRRKTPCKTCGILQEYSSEVEIPQAWCSNCRQGVGV